MDRLRTSTKRAHSPVAIAPQSPSVPQMDGSCFGKPCPAVAEAVAPAPGPPAMPEFLQLTDEG
jgi:hypothetical protein